MRLGFDSWVGMFPGEGNGYPLQYPCLKNSIDRRAWWATALEVTKSGTCLKDLHFRFLSSAFQADSLPSEPPGNT